MHWLPASCFTATREHKCCSVSGERYILAASRRAYVFVVPKVSRESQTLHTKPKDPAKRLITAHKRNMPLRWYQHEAGHIHHHPITVQYHQSLPKDRPSPPGIISHIRLTAKLSGYIIIYPAPSTSCMTHDPPWADTVVHSRPRSISQGITQHTSSSTINAHHHRHHNAQ